MATQFTSTSAPPWPSHREGTSTESTATETNPPLLLLLPFELRNHVYGYVLPTGIQEFRFSFSIFAKVPAVLQVCREMRSEALGIYYQDCSFDLVLHHRSLWQFKVWSKSLPEEACLHLRKNHGINIRLVMDKQHEEYDNVKALLYFYSVHKANAGEAYGWFISGEDTAVEHLPLELMVNIPGSRDKHGIRRAADNVTTYDQYKQAMKALKRRLRTTTHTTQDQKDSLSRILIEALRNVQRVLQERTMSR
ncbi:hypothetical protein LTR17_020734 [Elasticomyces elasticus]|nr:hypothetical protein LTR17_020734 [Elasticomyces elasticus]